MNRTVQLIFILCSCFFVSNASIGSNNQVGSAMQRLDSLSETDCKKAIELADSLLALELSSPIMASILIKKGLAHDIINQFSEALNALEEAEKNIPSTDSLLLFDHYLVKGSIYIDLGDYAISQKLLLSASLFLDKNAYPSKYLDLQIAMEALYIQSKQYDLALTNASNAIEFIDKNNLNLPKLRTKFYGNLGVTLMAQGYLDSALVYFNESIRPGNELLDIGTKSIAYNDIGAISFYKGNYKEAISHYTLAADLVKNEEKHEELLAICYINIGEAYTAIKDYEEAEKFLLRGLSLAEKIQKKNVQYSGHVYLVSLYQAQRDYKRALEQMTKADELNKTLFSESVNRQLHELQVRFDFEQKHQENLLLQRDKELLESNAKRQQVVLIGLLVIFMLTLIIMVVIFRNSRIRKKQNLKLLDLNNQINEKNQQLNNTLDQLKSAQSQLLQSEVMASLGTLTAGVAHEINNPLNFLQAGIIMLEQMADDNKNIESMRSYFEEQSSIVEKMKVGVTRTSKIVQSLDRFSRQDDTMMHACNLHTIIDDCLLILNNEIKAKSVIINDYQKEDIKLYGNEGKLHQVFLSVIKNANQAIESKGKIKIKTYVESNHAYIAISDNGTGIQGEYLSKVFDPFFTTKAPGKGVGLGLAITYRIIKEHGGEIRIDSTPGDGTTVKISLSLNINKVF